MTEEQAKELLKKYAHLEGMTVTHVNPPQTLVIRTVGVEPLRKGGFDVRFHFNGVFKSESHFQSDGWEQCNSEYFDNNFTY